MGDSLINNLKIDKKNNYVLISVNPRIYPLEVVYFASYSLMDRAFIILGGDPEKEILVEIKPKKEKELETLGREFNNELINYAVYVIQSQRNRQEKEMIMKRALQTSMESKEVCSECEEDLIGNPPVDDPENIAKPWKEDSEAPIKKEK